MSLALELAELFHRDLGRLAKQLRAFPDEKTLWETVPGVTNSGGNLALHLEGNLREFIGRQLGGIAYQRDRQTEFESAGIHKEVLAQRLDQLTETVTSVVRSLSDDALERIYPENVLGAPMTSRRFLVHLQGHLNYHLGQIDYLRRFLSERKAE